MLIQGSIPAIITPMHADGSLDLPRLHQLVDWHVREGSDAIVAVGTTGESPTVSILEHCEVIRATISAAAGRIPVIAGTGANATSEAIDLARFARESGAVAHLSVVPYYNKPTQEGLYLHYKKIAESVDLPMILYNVPGRTVADLHNDTALRLAQIPNIVGIKDATGNIERGAELIKLAPPSFAIYSGDDASALALAFLGSRGTISVTANIAPRLMHEMMMAAFAGNVARAREINSQLLGLHRNLFLEANPIPVKWASARMGLVEEGLRLPLTPFSPQFHEKLMVAMRAAGIQLKETK